MNRRIFASPAPMTPRAMLFIWLALLTFYHIWVTGHLNITLFVDEAQYWTWAKQPDWGYYSKPPVIAWLIAASTFAFGDGIVAVKLPALLLFPATAWLLYIFGTDIRDERTGLRCAVAFSLLPFVSAAGLFVATDAPLLFFWTLALLALNRALDSDRWGDWILLGAACGLGVMAKYTMLAFGASALLYLLIDGTRRRQLANPRLWAAAGIATLIILPNVLWNVAHDFPTLRHTADITHIEGDNDQHGNARLFMITQIVSLGPVIALAFLGALLLSKRRWHEVHRQLLLCFCLPLFGLVLIQAVRSEANGNWAAPAFVTSTVLAVLWFNERSPRWWQSAIAFNALLMVVAYHLPDAYALRGKPIPDRLDYFKRARAWDRFANQIRPFLIANPGLPLLTDSRTVSAHLLYQLRDLHPRLLEWNPGRHVEDHYQLTTPLMPGNQPDEYLYVTMDQAVSVANVTKHFVTRQTLARVSVTSGEKLRRSGEVIRLSGFKGYETSPVSLLPSPQQYD